MTCVHLIIRPNLDHVQVIQTASGQQIIVQSVGQAGQSVQIGTGDTLQQLQVGRPTYWLYTRLSQAARLSNFNICHCLVEI